VARYFGLYLGRRCCPPRLIPPTVEPPNISPRPSSVARYLLGIGARLISASNDFQAAKAIAERSVPLAESRSIARFRARLNPFTHPVRNSVIEEQTSRVYLRRGGSRGRLDGESKEQKRGTFSSEASRDVRGNDDRGIVTNGIRMAATVQFDRAHCFRGGRYFRRGVLSSSFADIDAAYQYAVSETEDAPPFCPCLIPVPARYDLAPSPSLIPSLSFSFSPFASFGQRQAEFKISRGIAATGARARGRLDRPMMGRGDRKKGQHESSGYVRELRREEGRIANFVRCISARRDNFSCHCVVSSSS